MILELSLSILVSLIHYYRSFNFVNLHTEVTVISKFAQFEFKYGDAERGCTILDTQLNVSYGIWNGRIHVTMATDSLEKVKPMVVLKPELF